ncbi:MAG TPA: ABC transporter transmembrane domain-containing protein, partial [Limnochordia bacterium]
MSPQSGAGPVSDGAGSSDPNLPLLCAGTDLTEDGRFGKRWLIVRDGELLVMAGEGTWPTVQGPYLRRQRHEMWDGTHLLLAAPPPPDAVTLQRLPLADVKSCKLRHEVGNAVVVVELQDGRRQPLVRLSGTLSRHLGLAARCIEKLAKGERLAIDPADLPYYCPKCGRRLPQHTHVCPTCLDKGAVFRRLLSYAYPYRYRMAAAAVLVLFTSLISLVPPQISKWMTSDLIALPVYLQRLTLLVLTLVAIQAANQGIHIVQARLGVWVASRIVGDLRQRVWNGLQRQSLSYFDRMQIGQLMARINNDTQRVQQFLTDGVPYFAPNALRLIGSLVLMLAMNWKLTLIVLLPSPTMIIARYYFWPMIRKLDRRLWQTIGRLNVVVDDVLSGIRVVKAFGQEEREVARFEQVNEELVHRNVQVQSRWQTIFPTFTFISGLGGVFLWYFGGRFIAGGQMEFPD